MSDQVKLKIYELNGMIASFIEIAHHHDSYNYPLMKNIQKTMNEIINLFDKEEKGNEKVIYPVRGYIKPNLNFSKGFHKNSNA